MKMNELLKIEEKCNLNPFIKERGSASKASIEEARRSDPCYIYIEMGVREIQGAYIVARYEEKPISKLQAKKSQKRA